MKKIKIVLHFPHESIDQPIVYHLVKDYDLELNILKAEINPKEEGVMVLELTGDDESYKKGIDYLRSVGLKVQLLSQDVSMDEDKCVDCTICVPLCPTQALVKDPETAQVSFIKEKCIACGICVPACPYGAMKIQF